ncbi:ankyrin [Lentithecium fluviatile CBS 122367]|uniref:Ankyrin n=1 Tax=Lentithecium fluviatile CBS 122367 TaxID=1168545 RepID=A0A6G1JAR8_9PLEO|nr:ankyrin [Lentithecium fluviatile CBS 122367]
MKGLLHRAVKYGQLRLVGLLIGLDLFFTHADWMEILLVATEAGQIRTVRQMTETHKKIPLTGIPGTDAPLHKYGRLPLHFACGSQGLEILRYLLSDKTNRDKIHQPDLDGWTPLHWACRQWDFLPVRYLVRDNGALIDCLTKENWTPWDVAVLQCNTGFYSELGQQLGHLMKMVL